MNDDDRTTAVGLARYAREYLDAALGADNAIGRRKGLRTAASDPVMFLVAHAIELGLKAYLLHQGLAVRDITRLGHDLNKCWRSATDHDIEAHFTLTAEDREVLTLVNALYVSTELTYIRTGAKRYPPFGPLQSMTQKLLDVICPLVGYR